MNYLSFSLWGDNPLYNVGAIRNSELIKEIYPEWKMMLYYDNSVPKETLNELEKNDVIIKNNTELNLYGMFWRFLASDIEDAEYVCFRDCDSRISYREYLATQEWIKSGKTLHVMRDHPAHRIPYGNDQIGILGGMWGIKSKILPMTSLIMKFNENRVLSYGSDQTFLKYIYQEFINDRYTHDDFFEKLPFPIKRENGRFVGERININEQPLTNDHLVLL
jgi:hypothetical protein